MTKTYTRPRWANYKQASAYSGISIRTLQDYVKDSLVRSAVVTKPNAKSGIRLLDINSLDQFIEQGIGKKVELAMNENRRATSE